LSKPIELLANPFKFQPSDFESDNVFQVVHVSGHQGKIKSESTEISRPFSNKWWSLFSVVLYALRQHTVQASFCFPELFTLLTPGNTLAKIERCIRTWPSAETWHYSFQSSGG